MLSERELKNLAELARIRLTKTEEHKLLGDLEKILAYVAELKEVNTDGVPPPPAGGGGGTLLTNATRADDGAGRIANDAAPARPAGGRAAFPESEKGFLKVPPVFE